MWIRACVSGYLFMPAASKLIKMRSGSVKRHGVHAPLFYLHLEHSTRSPGWLGLNPCSGRVYCAFRDDVCSNLVWGETTSRAPPGNICILGCTLDRFSRAYLKRVDPFVCIDPTPWSRAYCVGMYVGTPAQSLTSHKKVGAFPA